MMVSKNLLPTKTDAPAREPRQTDEVLDDIIRLLAQIAVRDHLTRLRSEK